MKFPYLKTVMVTCLMAAGTVLAQGYGPGYGMGPGTMGGYGPYGMGPGMMQGYGPLNEGPR